MPIDLSKFKETFLSEAKSHIKTMNNALLKLEKNPSDQKLFQNLIRSVHTLKSLSGTMNYRKSMELCHAIENLLEAIRESKITLENCIDILFHCFDYLNSNIKTLEKSENELDSSNLITQLNSCVETTKNSLINSSAYAVAFDASEIEKIQSIEVKVERLDRLMNLTEELLVTKMKFDLIREYIEDPELNPAVEALGRLITDLQYDIMQIRLVPIGFIFTRFLRMARDLAKHQKKEINVLIEGGEIELDRLLLDEIGEAIVHLIRNAIDHGLETPRVRKSLGKSPEGTISLKATRTKETAVIEVSDDGAGLDFQTIKTIAVKNKMLKHNASEQEVKEIIFSNLSTKSNVTEISGRGLGLSIVRQKIESINGRVRVDSIAGKGTSFYIEIPLTLAIIKTLFVKSGFEIYAIPLDCVERLQVVNPENFKGLLEYESIIFEDIDIPVVRLSELFGHQNLNLDKQPVVIIRKGQSYLGIVVDSLLSTQEVVIKPLSTPIRNNKYFSGAALTGSGKMVLILDVSYLMPTKKRVNMSV